MSKSRDVPFAPGTPDQVGPVFYTPYLRPAEYQGDPPQNDVSIVKQTGYMTTEDLVGEMMMAGRNLEAFRAARYDIPPGDRAVAEQAALEKDLAQLGLDPLRDLGVDQAEVSRIRREAQAAVEAARRKYLAEADEAMAKERQAIGAAKAKAEADAAELERLRRVAERRPADGGTP